MRFCATVFILSVALASCSMEKQCNQGSIYFHFKGFDSTELSRVIVKKYQKATGFGTAISEEEKQQDSTANARFEKSGLIRAYPEYDWILEVPLAGKSYKIRDIAYKNDDDGEKGRIPGISGERDACQDGINYIVNDVAGENPTGYNVGTGTSTEIKITK